MLTARPFGEHDAVVTVLARARGRHAGLLRGGFGRRGRGLIEPGQRVQAVWRARQADNLGHFTFEPLDSLAVPLMDRPLALAALQAAVAVAAGALPERVPHEEVHDGLLALCAVLAGTQSGTAAEAGTGAETVGAAYVVWERRLLQALGFGLALESCAVTGRTEGLAWVSPRTGRAVTAEAGAPWAGRLLPLPGFLIGAGATDLAAVLDGLDLTGYFLGRHLFAPVNRPLPEARARLVAAIARRAGPPGRAATEDSP